MGGFTKLFSSIVTSSLWCQDDAVIRVWVAMLATADATGKVEGAVPGFASLCRVSIPEMERVLGILMAPDEYSRTKDHDGKRLESCDGGWRILNYMKYRAIREADERREYQREWDRTHRAKANPTNPTISDKSDTIRPNPTQAEAEAEAEAEKTTTTVASASGQAAPVELKPRVKGRRKRADIILGFGPEVKAVVNTLLPEWPASDPKDGRGIVVDVSRFGQRVAEILKAHDEIDAPLLIEAGKFYCSSKRDRYQAPQWFFGIGKDGNEAAWVGCVRLILTKREKTVPHAS